MSFPVTYVTPHLVLHFEVCCVIVDRCLGRGGHLSTGERPDVGHGGGARLEGNIAIQLDDREEVTLWTTSALIQGKSQCTLHTHNL